MISHQMFSQKQGRHEDPKHRHQVHKDPGFVGADSQDPPGSKKRDKPWIINSQNVWVMGGIKFEDHPGPAEISVITPQTSAAYRLKPGSFSSASAASSEANTPIASGVKSGLSILPVETA